MIRNYLKKKINSRPPGPSDELRSRSKSFIWGEVSNDAGHKLQESMVTTDGYSLTAHSTLIIVQKILAGNNGNVSATARALNMHRRTLQRKLTKRPARA